MCFSQPPLSSCKRVTIALLCLAAMSASGFARKPEWSPERMLASVMIEDLVSPAKAAPSTSDTDTIASAEPESVLRAKGPSAADKVELQLNERTVLAELRHQIASHFQLQEDFRLYFDQAWRDLPLQSPHWELVVTAFPPQGLRSRFFLSFELWVDGKRHSSWQESVRCELWIDAYVATQQIERGSVMRAGFVAVKPVDRLSLYQGVVEIGTTLGDYVLNNGVKAGEPLFWRDLKERPLIEKNAIIDVVAEEGSLKVTLKAKAMETGVKGQVIRIRNLQSLNDIQAEVTGINQAKVYF